MLSKPCWRGGSTESDGSMQSKNNFNENKSSLKSSEDDSSKGKFLEEFSSAAELKDSDIQLRLIMHHGIPTSCCLLAYDPLEHMLALATKNGHIKVLKGCGLESILQPSKQCAIRFLQIFNNQSLLVCVNLENVIEVWDMSTSSLIGSQKWNMNITALGVIQDSTYFFIGDASGSVTVIKNDREQLEVNATAYIITVPQVFGDLSKDYSEKLSVRDILPQPRCEHERVLICYANGVCALWSLHDGEVIAVRAHTATALEAFSEPDSPAKRFSADITADEKNLTSVCWCCGDGVKFATGYNDGDIWIWSIDQTPDTTLVSDSLGHDSFNCSSTPLLKLKTGCFVPINVLRWWEIEDHKEGKEGFLCALGGKNAAANDVLKVISVFDACLSRAKYSIDLVVPEQLADCIPLHSKTWSSLEAKSLIMVLGSNGRLYAYDMKDYIKSFKSSTHTKTPSVIRPVSVNFNLSKSQVTKTKFIFLKKQGRVADYIMQMPRVFKPCLSLENLQCDKKGFTFGCKQTEYLTDLESEGCYLYITGHEDGLVYFWDLSTQIMSVCGPQFQGSTDRESINCPVSSLDFCSITGLLAVGYANGLISLHSLNLDNHNSYSARKTDEGKGGLSALWSFVSKFHTHKVSVSCTAISSSLQRVASGCENGMVSLFDLKTKTILYSGSCFTNKSSRIMSLNFVLVPTEHSTVPCWGFPALSRSKNKSTASTRMERILVTTKDLGTLVLDGETGVFLKTSPFKLKNPSSAISMHVLDASDPSLDIPSECHSELLPQKLSTANTVQTVHNTQQGENEIYGDINSIRNGTRQYLLLCSKNDLRIYKMPSSFEDVCSFHNKVKLDSPCQWASTFQTPSKRIGLVLLYSTGKIEIRCLPSLKLLKPIPSEGFLNWKIEPTLDSLRHIVCTSNGHIALVRDDEILVLSALDVKHDFRCSKLLPASPTAVEKKTGTAINSSANKKKKTLGKVIKATNPLLRTSDKGNKVASQKVADLDQLFTGKSSSTSGSLQSSHQFTDESHSESLSPLDLSSQNLDIDDIDIDDEDAPKDETATPSGRKFISKVKKNMKGKVKLRNHDSNKVRSSKGYQAQKSDAELSPVHGPRTVGEIKAAYKQGKDHSVLGTAAGLKDKLMQQKQKIGEVERKTADMQDGAHQFHKMAEELYKAVEEKNKRKLF